MNDLWRELEMEYVEKDYMNEKKGAMRDLEIKKHELRESLLCELEEKRRIIEIERHSTELTGDSMEVAGNRKSHFYVFVKMFDNIF